MKAAVESISNVDCIQLLTVALSELDRLAGHPSSANSSRYGIAASHVQHAIDLIDETGPSDAELLVALRNSL